MWYLISLLCGFGSIYIIKTILIMLSMFLHHNTYEIFFNDIAELIVIFVLSLIWYEQLSLMTDTDKSMLQMMNKIFNRIEKINKPK